MVSPGYILKASAHVDGLLESQENGWNVAPETSLAQHHAASALICGLCYVFTGNEHAQIDVLYTCNFLLIDLTGECAHEPGFDMNSGLCPTRFVLDRVSMSRSKRSKWSAEPK